MKLIGIQSITFKFTTYLVVLSLILFSIVGYIYFWQNQSDYLAEAHDLLKVQAGESSTFFQVGLEHHMQQSEMLLSLFVQLRKINDGLDRWQTINRQIPNDVVATYFFDGTEDNNQNVRTSPTSWRLSNEQIVQHQVYWQELLELQGAEEQLKPKWGELIYDNYYHTWLLGYMMPVQIEGKLEGIMVSTFEVDKLIRNLQKPLINNATNIFIYDQNQQLVHHPDYGARLIRRNTMVGEYYSGENIIRAPLDGYIKQTKIDGDVYKFVDWGKDVYAVSYHIPANGWTVVNYMSESVIFARSTSHLYHAFLVLMIGLTCVAVAAVWLTRRYVSNRLSYTSSVLNRITNGQLDRQFSISGNDEIDELHRHINVLTQRYNSRFDSKLKEISLLKTELDENKALAQAVSHSDSAVLLLELDFTVNFVDTKSLSLLNTERDEIVGTRFFTHIHEHMAFVSEQIINDIRRKDSWHGELVLKVKGSSKEIWVNTTITPLRNDAGHVTKYVVSMQDISFIKDSENKIEKLAYTDELTGLANRSFFMAQLEKCIEMQKRGQFEFAILHFDIDNFKRVNDNLGFEGGDELLIKVAERLAKELDSDDVLARLGGDSFAYIIMDATSEQSVLLKVNELLNLVSEAFKLKNKTVHISTSIGITMSTSDDPNLLLQHADLAMYEAKSKGKNTFHFYTEELNIAVQNIMSIEVALIDALQNNQLELYYQPKVDLVNLTLVGYEALLRWHDPELGFISPDKFIPIAEQTDLILDITDWVIENAIQFITELEHPVPVSINLSGKQFEKGNCAQILKHALDKYHVKPSLLEVEITESHLMKDVEEAVNQLEEVKNIGVQISIDDFGTGYSSLSYLKRFPVDTLKIDRSFIADIPEDNNDVEITAAIIAMAQQLGLKVIAEGAETKEQIDFLLEKGCYFVQGYYYSQPLPADKAKDWKLSS